MALSHRVNLLYIGTTMPCGIVPKGDNIMSQINSTRSGCKDVFHAFLLKSANYAGEMEIPIIYPTSAVPNKLITFSKILRTDDFDQWVCFYEDDGSFERIWRNPHKYLPILAKFNGVITPDFSLYRDMPLIMQIWNIFRSRALGHWFQENGLNVVVNIRWGDRRTHFFTCLGAPKNSTIAVGSVGCTKLLEDRKHFVEGLDYVVKKLKPRIIVVYGAAPDYIFEKYKKQGIKILQFDSETAKAHKAGDA